MLRRQKYIYIYIDADLKVSQDQYLVRSQERNGVAFVMSSHNRSTCSRIEAPRTPSGPHGRPFKTGRTEAESSTSSYVSYGAVEEVVPVEGVVEAAKVVLG